MHKLKSYKVVSGIDGTQKMVIIISSAYSLKTLNSLFKNGMNVVVTDERSYLVDKNKVDN